MSEEAREGEALPRPPAERGTAAPGSRPYLRLAVVVYLAQVAYPLALLALLTIVSAGTLLTSTPSILASAVLALFLSVAWIQVGRKQGVSWFVAAGSLGGVNAVITTVVPFSELSSPMAISAAGFRIGVEVESLVSLLYFAAQLVAFWTAAGAFQVKPFRYAAYLLAAGFVVPLVSAALVGLMYPSFAISEASAKLTYGLVLAISAGTSMAAVVGFHLAGRLPLSRSAHPAAEGAAYSAEPPVPS